MHSSFARQQLGGEFLSDLGRNGTGMSCAWFLVRSVLARHHGFPGDTNAEVKASPPYLLPGGGHCVSHSKQSPGSQGVQPVRLRRRPEPEMQQPAGSLLVAVLPSP